MCADEVGHVQLGPEHAQLGFFTLSWGLSALIRMGMCVVLQQDDQWWLGSSTQEQLVQCTQVQLEEAAIYVNSALLVFLVCLNFGTKMRLLTLVQYLELGPADVSHPHQKKTCACTIFSQPLFTKSKHSWQDR